MIPTELIDKKNSVEPIINDLIEVIQTIQEVVSKDSPEFVINALEAALEDKVNCLHDLLA